MAEVAVRDAGLIAEAVARLRAAGIAAPRREALRLWSDRRGTTSSALLQSDGDVAADLAADFLGLVSRRAAGEPLAYVGGTAGFRRLLLGCDRRALIPRPETEGLVDLLLERVRTGRAADIGTGSGCLALSLATEGSFRAVVAVDRSPEALGLARENRARVSEARGGTAATVYLARGDLTTPLRTAAFDALVANPPYLTEREYAALERSVRDWEPAAALVSGADGLEATTRLLDDGRRVLRPDGWLAVEVDGTRAAECARRAGALGWRDVAIHNDLFGRERYLLARRSDNP